MVDSWRVNTAMSFCLIALPPLRRRFLDLGDENALTTQACIEHGLTTGTHFTADKLAVLVLALPVEDHLPGVLCGRCSRHSAFRGCWSSSL